MGGATDGYMDGPIAAVALHMRASAHVAMEGAVMPGIDDDAH